MGKILSLQEYVVAWKASHPHDVVKKGKAEGVSLWQRIAVLFALTAVNILSSSHTIPVFLDTVHVDDPTVRFIIAVAAFIAIEFTMILFMVFGKAGWLRTLVIGGALIVAIVANLTNTIDNLSKTIGPGGVFVGVVLGLFAPLANLGIGEVYREMTDRAKEASITVEKEYQDAWKMWDAKVRREYKAYLVKQGVKDETAQLAYMSGQIVEDTPEPKPENVPPRVNKPQQDTYRNKDRVLELVDAMRRDGTENATYNDLQSRYKASASTVRDAKRMLSGMA